MADPAPRFRALAGDAVASRLWVASTTSVLGDFVGQGALLLLAFERTGGRILGPAALLAVQALPALLSGALAGSWLDRIDRRRALVALHLAGGGALALPLALPGFAPILLAAALLGALRAAIVSVRSGAIAEGVDGHLRGPLLAALGTSDQAGQVVGYLAGAAVALTVGAAPALAADAVTFAVAAAVVARCPLPRPERRDRRPAVTAGLRAIWSDPVLRVLALAVWATTTVTALPEALAAGAAGADGRWTPLVLAAAPAGQALTMVALGRARPLPRPRFHLAHLAWLALAFGIAALGRGPIWYVVGNLLVGSGVAWMLGPQTLFVRVAPPERMAQITGTMIAGIIAAEGAGALGFAALADATTVAAAYRAAGFLVLAIVLVAWFAVERTPAAVELDEAFARQP